jgi:hypothetical protein
MKKLLFLFVAGLFSHILLSNNVSITNVTTPDNQHVQFTITWENSWFTTSNYDAVWVFIKAQDCSGTSVWEHISLSTVALDHSATGGLYVEPAISDGMGVFVRRNVIGFGNVTSTVNVKLASSYTNYTSMNWQVFGIEMV